MHKNNISYCMEDLYPREIVTLVLQWYIALNSIKIFFMISFFYKSFLCLYFLTLILLFIPAQNDHPQNPQLAQPRGFHPQFWEGFWAYQDWDMALSWLDLANWPPFGMYQA